MLKDFTKVITIDGTSGSGKGTLARKLAQHFGYKYLDTGKLYRALAKLILDRNLHEDYINHLDQLMQDVAGYNLDDPNLYYEQVSNLASIIAKEKQVRNMLFNLQRDFVMQDSGVVIDGRDMGTVICPEAKYKFYVEADLEVRAKRRYGQFKNKYLEENITVNQIRDALAARDKADMERKESPLKVPEGAVIIDNSKDELENTVQKMINRVEGA